jgi:DNA polymerase elongation subunit (family B)
MNTRLHGTCHAIKTTKDLTKLSISRDLFLTTDLKAQVATKVVNKRDVLFLGNDIAETYQRDTYQLIMHGILPCGSKTTVTINGIHPYVDVRLRDDESTAGATERIHKLAQLSSIEDVNNPKKNFEVIIAKIEFDEGKDFMFYDHRVHRYARVYFNELRARKLFIDQCDKTYSNDKSTYYRVVSRKYDLNLSGWNVLTNYEDSYSETSKAKYSLLVDINSIVPIADDAELARIAVQQGFDPSLVKYENIIICSFDIEMIPEKPDRFPDADKNAKDSIFMICMTYHFVKRPESILSVCLTLKAADPLDEVLMIHCHTEKCLLEAFAKFMSFMQPYFITEFNGGGFDWRNVITKTRKLLSLSPFLEDMSIVRLSQWDKAERNMDRYHRESRIKINGATPDSICKGLNMQGFVSFDTLVVFKQLEPNADSHKLNECLRRCNLGSKDDMDVKEMFRIYREGTSAEMRLVAHYCFIDTFKLQQLLLKKNVIQDRREVANLSYTSMHDNF